jgi:hypothetical protein
MFLCPKKTAVGAKFEAKVPIKKYELGQLCLALDPRTKVKSKKEKL